MEKGLKSIFEMLKEAGQTAGSVAGIVSLLRDMKPAAESVLDNVAPEISAKIRMNRERQEQRTSDGPADDNLFIKTVNLLDGTDPHLTYRPLAKNIESYLRFLLDKDPVLSVSFIFVVGLKMDDAERFAFLMRLAQFEDENGFGDTEEANVLRYNHTQLYEAFRKPEGVITRYLRNHPDLVETLKAIPVKIKEHLANYSDGIARDLEETGVNAALENFKSSGWQRLSERKAARAANRLP